MNVFYQERVNILNVLVHDRSFQRRVFAVISYTGILTFFSQTDTSVDIFLSQVSSQCVLFRMCFDRTKRITCKTYWRPRQQLRLKLTAFFHIIGHRLPNMKLRSLHIPLLLSSNQREDSSVHLFVCHEQDYARSFQPVFMKPCSKAEVLPFPGHQISWVSEWVSDWVCDFFSMG